MIQTSGIDDNESLQPFQSLTGCWKCMFSVSIHWHFWAKTDDNLITVKFSDVNFTKKIYN